MAFYDLVIAQGPVNYWRNGEASGTSMVDEVAADGLYLGAPTLNNPPLYPGGPTAVGGNFDSSNSGYSAESPASLTSMTLITVVRPTDLTGFRLLGVQRDENGAGRKYQWRSNGDSMEFVKIAGGVETVSQSGMLAINTTYLLAFEVDAAGSYAMYRNGIAVQTGTIAGGDYGGGGDPYRIGYADGPSTNLVGTTCENAVFDKVLGPSVHAALYAATGLGTETAQILAGVTQVATGKVIAKAVAARTLANVTRAATGKVLAKNAAAQTLAGITQTAAGTVASSAVSIVGSQTTATPTNVASATATVKAAAGSTLGGVVQVANGTTSDAARIASAAQTLAGVVATAVAAVRDDMAAGQTLAGVNQVAAATVADTIYRITGSQVLANVVQIARIDHEYVFLRDERTYSVPAQNRALGIAPSNRSTSIGRSDRTHSVAASSRILTVE